MNIFKFSFHRLDLTPETKFNYTHLNVGAFHEMNMKNQDEKYKRFKYVSASTGKKVIKFFKLHISFE